MFKTINWQRLLITIIALIGVLTTIKLTYIYYNANFVPNATPSFCAISEKLDCDGVARTPYSHFLGVPTSIYGLMFYLFVLFLNYVEFLKDFSLFRLIELKIFKRPYSYIFTLASVSLGVSVLLAAISSFVIQKICILCYFTYMLNFVLLILSKSGASTLDHFKNTFSDFVETVKIKKYSVISSVSLVTVVILFGVINYFSLFVPTQAKDIFGVQGFQYKKDVHIGNTLGDRNARVIIHEYTDYQCPYCGISNSMLNRLVSEFNGIKIVHHNYPLDKLCNPSMKSAGHKGSCLYSRYGLAAELQGKLWDFNNIIFSNNQGLTEAKVLNYAAKVGLNIDELKKDANSPALKKKVVDGINEAKAIGVTATPTYRIGIKKYEGLMPYEELQYIVVSQGATPKR